MLNLMKWNLSNLTTRYPLTDHQYQDKIITINNSKAGHGRKLTSFGYAGKRNPGSGDAPLVPGFLFVEDFMENGWIKIYRKMLSWEWFNDSKTLHVFIYLLLEANHSDKKWRGIDVKRGQIITGRLSISKATGISQQSVRTAISNLISTNEITSKPTNKFSLITIYKYEQFQIKENAINQQINQQSTSNQPAINHKQELKNERIKEQHHDGNTYSIRELHTLCCKNLGWNPGNMTNGQRKQLVPLTEIETQSVDRGFEAACRNGKSSVAYVLAATVEKDFGTRQETTNLL